MKTSEFQRWSDTLDAERREQVKGAINHVVNSGPTLGRPLIDVIHGSRLHKLKEVRVDQSTRLLFAFDSNRDVVMLVGGDKSGKWNRWYPQKVALAERLYAEHERRSGQVTRCLTPRPAERPNAQRSH